MLHILFAALILGHSTFAADCSDDLAPDGRSFVVVYDRLSHGPPTSADARANQEDFIARDLLPFLEEAFPKVGPYMFTRMPIANRLVVHFPIGQRPSLAAFMAIQRRAPVSVRQIFAGPNGPGDAFAK